MAIGDTAAAAEATNTSAKAISSQMTAKEFISLFAEQQKLSPTDTRFLAAGMMEEVFAGNAERIKLNSPAAKAVLDVFGLGFDGKGQLTGNFNRLAGEDPATQDQFTDAMVSANKALSERMQIIDTVTQAHAEIKSYLAANDGKGANQYASWADESMRKPLAQMIAANEFMRTDSGDFNARVEQILASEEAFNTALKGFQSENGFKADGIVGPETMIGIEHTAVMSRAPVSGLEALSHDEASTVFGSNLPHTSAMTNIVYSGDTFDINDKEAVKALEGQLAMIQRREVLKNAPAGTDIKDIEAGTGFAIDGTLSEQELKALRTYRGTDALAIAEGEKILDSAQMQALLKASGAAQAALLMHQAGITDAQTTAEVSAQTNVGQQPYTDRHFTSV